MRIRPAVAATAALLAGLSGLAAPTGRGSAGAPPAAGPAPSAEPPAGRRPLLRSRLSVQGPDSSILRGADGAEVVITYREGGRSRQLTYQPPDALEVTVEASVKTVPDDPLNLVYSYQLASSRASRQSAADFVVGFRGPIGRVASPQGWEVKPLASTPALDWSSKTGLGAGNAATGFSFSASTMEQTDDLDSPAGGLPGFVHSRGALPGIVECYAVGDAQPPAALTAASPPLSAILAALPRFPRNGVGGSTVGPLEIPSGDDRVAALLGSMTEYVKTSLALGWIERRETADAYLRALDAIRRDWTAGQGKRSLTHLQLQAVERQSAADWSARRLTSEAYALLNYNSYWLSHWLEEHEP